MGSRKKKRSFYGQAYRKKTVFLLTTSLRFNAKNNFSESCARATLKVAAVRARETREGRSLPGLKRRSWFLLLAFNNQGRDRGR